MKKRGDIAGYTFIELIIVLTLVSTLLSISCMSFGATKKRSALLRESTSLRIALERSYLRAVNVPTKVMVTLHRDRYRLNYTQILKKNGQEREKDTKISLPPGITLQIKNPPTSIYFYPSGVTSPKTIIMTDGTSSCTITLSLRGRASRLCS